MSDLMPGIIMLEQNKINVDAEVNPVNGIHHFIMLNLFSFI